MQVFFFFYVKDKNNFRDIIIDCFKINALNYGIIIIIINIHASDFSLNKTILLFLA